jgi:hypothetical protein
VDSAKNPSFSFKQLISLVQSRFNQIISRLNEIDDQINQIILNDFSDRVRNELKSYCEYALSPKVPEYRAEPLIWLQDFLMNQICSTVRNSPNGILLINDDALELIWHQIYSSLKISVLEIKESLQKELSFLLQKPFLDWILNDFFHYHINRFGSRPIVWHLTDNCSGPLNANTNLFIHYSLLNANTISHIINDFPISQTFRSNLIQFTQKSLKVPSPNSIIRNNAVRGQGADMVFRWLFKQVQNMLDMGYKPHYSDGILINLLPFSIENKISKNVDKSKPWPQMCPDGTFKLILKKIEALSQLRAR